MICGVVFESPTVPEVCPVCGAGSEQFIEVVEDTVPFNNNSNENFIIIGNGAAGFSAAESIRKRNTSCAINIISAENVNSYYRPQLSDYLSSDISDDEFYIAKKDWYKENNITLTLNSIVISINSNDKYIILQDNSKINYDKLILANGSYNFIPNITGSDKKGVFTLKYLKDAENIKEYAKTCKNAVIIGGGLLGLEAAWELKKLGLNISVIEFQNRLLPKQLDEDGAKIFNTSIAKSGVTIILDDSLEEILGDDKVTSIKLKSGKSLETDLVLFSVGIRPNTNLALTAGINVNKGVIVNDLMETNVKDIYACGDLAETCGKIYGNWLAAIEMGKIAGANACGDNIKFNDFTSSVIFNALNTEMFSCGIINSSDREICFKNDAKCIYKKIFFKDDKACGAILIGDTKISGKLIADITKGKSYSTMVKEELF